MLVRRPVRWGARPEPVALVRPAQPVVCRAAVGSPANGEQLTIDLDREQHGSRPAFSAVVHGRNGEPVAVATIVVPVHRARIDGCRRSRLWRLSGGRTVGRPFSPGVRGRRIIGVTRAVTRPHSAPSNARPCRRSRSPRPQRSSPLATAGGAEPLLRSGGRPSGGVDLSTDTSRFRRAAAAPTSAAGSTDDGGRGGFG